MLKKVILPYKDLPRSIFVIFFARVINAAGHFVLPFMTMLLTEKIGLTKEATGFYIMLAAISYIPGSIIGGKLTDMIGRKKIYMIFQSLAAICYVPIAFVESSMIVPWLLILSGMFSGAAGPANAAMVADLTNKDNRKQAYSLLYLGHNLGFAIGPMVAGLLYRNYVMWLFLGDAATTIIAVGLVAFFINETIPDQEKIIDMHDDLGENEKAESGSFIQAWVRRPILSIFMLLIMLYSFVYVQHQFSLPIYMNEIFLSDGARLYGLLMMVNALTVILFTTMLTNVTLKLKPIACVAIGGLFYGLGFGMLSFIKSFPMFLLSTYIWTLGEILIGTNGMAYVANNTPISHRGRFNAVIPIIAEGGHALGPFLTGKFLMQHSVLSVWKISFFLAIIVSICMFMLQAVEGAGAEKRNILDAN
ncbi:MAG: MFS transporter [Bacillota bacterium]